MNTRTLSHKIGLITLATLSVLGTGCASTTSTSAPMAQAKIELQSDEVVMHFNDNVMNVRKISPDIVTAASRTRPSDLDPVVSYDIPGYARDTLTFASTR
jgi:hypothetical protein